MGACDPLCREARRLLRAGMRARRGGEGCNEKISHGFPPSSSGSACMHACTAIRYQDRIGLMPPPRTRVRLGAFRGRRLPYSAVNGGLKVLSRYLEGLNVCAEGTHRMLHVFPCRWSVRRVADFAWASLPPHFPIPPSPPSARAIWPLNLISFRIWRPEAPAGQDRWPEKEMELTGKGGRAVRASAR